MKREKRPVQRCWVPGCPGDSNYLKAHTYYDRIPSSFDKHLQPTDEQVLRGRRNALKQAGRWLLGRPVELDELVAFVVVQKMLSQTDNTEITDGLVVCQQRITDRLVVRQQRTTDGLVVRQRRSSTGM